MVRINDIGDEIRRTPLVALRTDYGAGYRPDLSLRTPHQHTYEPEPGGPTWPGITKQKFLPDGRLVPAGALGGAAMPAETKWALVSSVAFVAVGVFLLTR